MPALYEIADVMRSKNAGPFLITVDIMFRSEQVYRHVCASGALQPAAIASRCGIGVSDVRIICFDPARAIKITYPRTGGACGGPGDRDVYGAQQHGQLMDIPIPALPE